VYVQDSWKVSKNLTLDYGVRFAYDLKVYDKTNVGGNFEPALYNRSQTATLYIPAKNAQGTRVAEDPRTGTLYSCCLHRLVRARIRPILRWIGGGWRRRVSARIRGQQWRPVGSACGFAYDPFRRWKRLRSEGASASFTRGALMREHRVVTHRAVYSQTQYYGNVEHLCDGWRVGFAGGRVGSAR